MKAVKDAPKPAPSSSPTHSSKPLITPFALQSVQLRSVKRPEKEINGQSDDSKAQETGVDLLQDLKPQTLEKSHSLEHPTVLPLSNCSTDEDSRHSSPSPVSKLLEELSLDCSITDYTPDSAVINGKAEDQSYFLLNGKESLNSPPQSSQSSPVKQKPPAVSKKPKIPFVPPFTPQPISEQLPSQHEDTSSPSQTEDEVDAPQILIEEEKESKSEQQEEEEEETSESSEPPAESSETSTVSQDESHVSASASQETSLDNGLCANGEAHEEEEEGDGASSTTGSISSKEDDTGESLCFMYFIFCLPSFGIT